MKKVISLYQMLINICDSVTKMCKIHESYISLTVEKKSVPSGWSVNNASACIIGGQWLSFYCEPVKSSTVTIASATSTNISNITVAKITIPHDGRISAIRTNCGWGGGSGPVSGWWAANISRDSTNVSFNLDFAAVSHSYSSMNLRMLFPICVNRDAY